MNGGYIWTFLWVPLALLVGMALACLIRLARERRKGLLTVTVAVGMCAAVLFGGDWLLAGQGMTWRTAPLNVLCALQAHVPSMTDFERDPMEVIETGDLVFVNADEGYIEVTKKNG